MELLGYRFFNLGVPYDLTLVGLRSAENRSNLFDDTFCCIFSDEDGKTQFYRWPFTADPGRASLKKPMRTEGCAILVPGQYRGAWRLGFHQGRKEHPALVQAAPVEVWRDNNLDDVANYGGPTQKGMFGVNIHRAGPDSKLVESWSAGCQVFRRQADHKKLIELCRKQQELHAGWDRFSYTLIDVRNAPKLAFLMLPVE